MLIHRFTLPSSANPSTPVFALLLLVAGLLAWSGCDSSDDEAPTGVVSGRITAADGTTPIPNATVGLAIGDAASANLTAGGALANVLVTTAAVDTDGPTTTTDINGNYTLTDVPAGQQTLAAKSGVFETTFTVDVAADEEVTAEPAELTSSMGLAYLPGDYDSIEDIVRVLGNDVEEIDANTLSDVTALEQYGIVFLNCGSLNGAYSDAQVSALRSYMEGGGTVYASDLEAPLARSLLNGPSGDVITLGSGNVQDIVATVVSSDLESFVGQTTVDLAYDLPGWQRITSFNASSDRIVLLEGQPQELDSGTEPLAIRANIGSGRFILTTFHNEPGATSSQEDVLRYYIYLPS